MSGEKTACRLIFSHLVQGSFYQSLIRQKPAVAWEFRSLRFPSPSQIVFDL